jgi:hypothetical protein
MEIEDSACRSSSGLVSPRAMARGWIGYRPNFGIPGNLSRQNLHNTVILSMPNGSPVSDNRPCGFLF